MAQFFLGFGILFAVLAILMITLTLGGLNTRHNFTAAGWFGLSSGTCLLVGVFLWAIMIPSQTEEWQYGSNVYLTLLGSVSGIFGGAIPLRLRKRAFANVENWPTKTRVQSPAGYASPQVASPNPVQPQLQWSGMPVEKRRLEEAYDKLPSAGPQQVQQVQGTQIYCYQMMHHLLNKTNQH
jgi:4-amino-4-deoxy-L-arabinose transferase-like glycosyltransferase